jgi:hypothetical protein
LPPSTGNSALFGRDHYGAISGALAGPSLAALIEIEPSVPVVQALLLAVSLVSLACYMNAIGIRMLAPATWIALYVASHIYQSGNLQPDRMGGGIRQAAAHLAPVDGFFQNPLRKHAGV